MLPIWNVPPGSATVSGSGTAGGAAAAAPGATLGAGDAGDADAAGAASPPGSGLDAAAPSSAAILGVASGAAAGGGAAVARGAVGTVLASSDVARRGRRLQRGTAAERRSGGRVARLGQERRGRGGCLRHLGRVAIRRRRVQQPKPGRAGDDHGEEAAPESGEVPKRKEREHRPTAASSFWTADAPLRGDPCAPPASNLRRLRRGRHEQGFHHPRPSKLSVFFRHFGGRSHGPGVAPSHRCLASPGRPPEFKRPAIRPGRAGPSVGDGKDDAEVDRSADPAGPLRVFTEVAAGRTAEVEVMALLISMDGHG